MNAVALVTVRKSALEAFRAFETHAAMIMSDYGGHIDRTVVVNPENTPDVVIEIHLISFPDEKAFAAYRRDDRIGQLDHLRKQSVVRTELYVGEDGPEYFAASRRRVSRPVRDLSPEADETPAAPDPGLSFAVQNAIRKDRKLEAIRLLREERGIELMQAKRIVDAQFKAHRQTYGPPPPQMESGYGRLVWLGLALVAAFALFWLFA
jgi:hypothetical protein